MVYSAGYSHVFNFCRFLIKLSQIVRQKHGKENWRFCSIKWWQLFWSGLAILIWSQKPYIQWKLSIMLPFNAWYCGIIERSVVHFAVVMPYILKYIIQLGYYSTHLAKLKVSLFQNVFLILYIFQKTTEKFDKFLPKNMKGVEIIKIKTMPYTITIYIWLYGLFNVFKDISLIIWPLFRSLGRNLSNFSVVFWKI